MSYSQKAKNELARKMPGRECCQRAEFRAFIEINSSIVSDSKDNLQLRFTTKNASAARKVFKLNKLVFGDASRINIRKNRSSNINNLYIVRISVNTENKKAEEREIPDLVDIGEEHNAVLGNQGLWDCCTRAYLRGAFLAGGSLVDPKKAYHLEIRSSRENISHGLLTHMGRFHLEPGISRRKQWYVVYLKEADRIADFLNAVGAHTTLLDFEDIRVYKGVRNRVNRLVNCETANMSKSINASLMQIDAIRTIRDTVGLEKLPEGLYEIAKLRLENADASLKELGEIHHPPMSKPSVNYRMRKLMSMANKIKSGKCLEG
ncbi:MAG: DNA-binding protein WhiA [Clostridia bacterium]|nr:DNA-binding protein WhiA [Clostridia bacterium]